MGPNKRQIDEHGMRKVVLVWFCVIALFTTPAIFAQVSISSSDFLSNIGVSGQSVADTSGSVTVNVGSPGANQVYDFTNQVIPSPDTIDFQFISPSGTPFESNFPSANIVEQFMEEADGTAFDLYQYFEVTTQSITVLGIGNVVGPPINDTFVDTVDSEVAPLPMTYNNTWVSTNSDTFGDPATFAIVSIDSTYSTVDGWGTVRLPIGDFPALRIRDNNTYTSLTIYGGIVINSMTTTEINYSYIGETGIALAGIESQENESNPNYTVAQSINMLSSTATGIGDFDRPSLIADFQLKQNYPNPFNPRTVIGYSLSVNSSITLTVYDILGKAVRTLVQGVKQAGNHAVEWDGRDNAGNLLGSGVYYYQLRVGGDQQTHKMIMMK